MISTLADPKQWQDSCCFYPRWGFMIELEVHPEIHVHEQRQRPDYSTCYECHRSFRAKSEDQLCLELCDNCFDTLRHLREPVISVHIKVRPHRPAFL